MPDCVFVRACARARVHPEALTVHLTTFLGQSVFVAGASVHMMSFSWSQTAACCCPRHRAHTPINIRLGSEVDPSQVSNYFASVLLDII